MDLNDLKTLILKVFAERIISIWDEAYIMRTLNFSKLSRSGGIRCL